MSDGLSLDDFVGGSAPSGGLMAPYYDATMMAESAGNPNAVSATGAQGLMQLEPETAASPGYGITPARDKSSAENLRVGRSYLDAMGSKYGDPVLALAAYNAGPGNLDKAIAKAQSDGITDPAQVLNYLPKPEETVPYVRRILGHVDPTRAAQITGYGSGSSGSTQKSGMSLDDFMAGSAPADNGMSLDDFVGSKPIQATAAQPTQPAAPAHITPHVPAPEPSIGGFLTDIPMRAASEVGQDVHDAINYFRTTPKEQIIADAKANAAQTDPGTMLKTMAASASHGLGEMVSGVGDLIDTAFPKTAETLKGGGEVLQSVGGTPSPTFVGRVQQAVGGMAPNLLAAMAAPELDAAKILPTLSKIPGVGAFLERLVGQSPRAGVMTLTQIAQNPNMSMEDIQNAAKANLLMFSTPGQINSANPVVRVGSAAVGNVALNEIASRMQGQRPTMESNVASALVGGAASMGAHGEPNVPRSTEPQPTPLAGQEAAGSPQPAASTYDVTGGAKKAVVEQALGKEAAAPILPPTDFAPPSVKPHVVYRDGQWVPAERTPVAAAPQIAEALNEVNTLRAERGMPPLPEHQADDMIRAIDESALTGKDNVDQTGLGNRGGSGQAPPTPELETVAAASRASSAEAQARTEPSVSQLPPNAPTSIKNAVTEAEATRDHVAQTFSESQPGNKVLWQGAMDRAAADPDYGKRLAAEIATKPRPATAEEVASLLHDRVRIHNESRAAEAAVADTTGKTKEQQTADLLRLHDIEQQRELNDLASRQSGSQQANAFRARQLLANMDYSLEHVMHRAAIAEGGTVPKDVQAKLEDAVKRLQDAEAELERLRAKKAPSGPKKSVDERMQAKVAADIAKLEKTIRERLSSCPV